MPVWTENSMQEALEAVDNGLSRKKAAKQSGIPLTTLRHRLSGSVTVKQNAIDRQALSDVQESQLARWIIVQEALGAPASHYQIRCAAEKSLQAGGIKKKLGKNWVANLMRRNPSVDTYQGKKVDTKRARAVTPNKIKALFEATSGPLLRDIRAQYRYNMDEIGIIEGVSGNGKYVASVTQPGTKKKPWVLINLFY